MRIGIDIDGVLAEFNTEFKKSFPRIPDDFVPDVWDWPRKYGATDKEIEEAWDDLWYSSTFWPRLSPYPEMLKQVKVINTLTEDGYEIYYITARNSWNAKFDTETWLLRHGIRCPTVIISEGKQKGKICSALGLDAMLDDSVENIIPISDACPAYLLDRPWNQYMDSDPVMSLLPVKRVRSISEYWKELGIQHYENICNRRNTRHRSRET